MLDPAKLPETAADVRGLMAAIRFSKLVKGRSQSGSLTRNPFKPSRVRCR
jgi:hypothetical protein